MKIKYVLDIIDDGPSIFLAGPTHRITDDESIVPVSWRQNAINLLDSSGFKGTVYVPEWKKNQKDESWTYERQLSWEVEALTKASIILFWIPRDLDKLPALTTNIEFGEWLNSGKIVIGAPKGSQKNRYLQVRCDRLEIPWFVSLEKLVDKAVIDINAKSQPETKIWFTSDTHFGAKRTLELSKRPFSSVESMDWTMIKNWNVAVGDNDAIYHLGDFGDPKYLKHLKAKKIMFLPGNYDNKDILNELQKDERVQIIKSGFKFQNDIILIHEPDSARDGTKTFYLYGHIHRLQFIKRNGLNIGVDCNDYTPVSLGDVEFQINAINKGYYDENVFMDIIGK